MVKAEATEKLMELAWEYKHGLRDMKSAVIKGSYISGLDHDTTEMFLRGLLRDNIVRVDFSKKTRNGREARRTVGPGPKLPD
jgi:hypothetical protein